MHPKFEAFIDKYLPKANPLNATVKTVLENVWELYRKLPASSTGRYHHVSENCIPYGLVNHTMRTVWFVNELVTEEQGMQNKDSKKRLEAIAAAFFHDLGKLETFKGNHAVYGLKYLQLSDVSSEIKSMVKSHMHYWSPWPANGVYERIIAYGDYFASRPEIEIVGFEYLSPEDEKDEGK